MITLGGVMKQFLYVIIPVALILTAYQNCGDKSFSGTTNSVTALSNSNDDDQNINGGESSGGASGGSAGQGTAGSASGGSVSGGSGSGGSTSGGSTSGGSTSGGLTGGGSTTGNVNQNDIEQAKVQCDNARRLNQLRTSNQKIVFDDTRIESGRSNVCLFEVGNNLAMRDTRMQARYEQYRTLNLPANAVVCDLNMTTPLQRFRYDDVFVFTYNNRVLATNNRSALFQSRPEATLQVMNAGNVPVYNYDWLSLRTRAFQNVADDYCLGASQGAASCRWPVTEQNGNIQFDFDQQLLIALGLVAPSNNQQFGFIITGDNDPSLDCYHERLEFDMTVEYYLK